MRADAEANRDAIIAAATALIADVGVEVPMRAVASEAGVGIGTLYRHFPDRESLLRGVADHMLSLILAAMERADDAWSAAPETAWRTLVMEIADLHLGRLLPQLARFPGMVEDGSWAQDLRRRGLLGMGGLLERAKQEGLVRDDVDVLHLQIGIAQISRPVHAYANELVPDWQAWLVETYLRGLRP